MAREDSGASRSSVTGSVHAAEEYPPTAGPVAFGPYLLRADIRCLERDGRPVQLGDRAFDILCVLTERPGEIVTNRELLARVWGKVVVGQGSLRFHINALRKALAQDGARTQYIKNVTRRGYAFIAPVYKPSPYLPGRAMELQEIAQVLGRARMVTLVSCTEVSGEQFLGRTPESVALIAILMGTVAGT